MDEQTQIERPDRQVHVRLFPSVYQAIRTEAKAHRRSFTAQINYDLERQYGLIDSEPAEREAA